MSIWERIIRELEDCNCPFCDAKITQRKRQGIPEDYFRGEMWDCPKVSSHENIGQMWAYFKDDDPNLGLTAINLRRGTEMQFSFMKSSSSFRYKEAGFPVPLNFSLKMNLSQIDALIKTLIIFS